MNAETRSKTVHISPISMKSDESRTSESISNQSRDNESITPADLLKKDSSYNFNTPTLVNNISSISKALSFKLAKP